MNTFKDNLGSVFIPASMLEKAAAYTPPITKSKPTKSSGNISIAGYVLSAEWQPVWSMLSSNGKSVHTVSARLSPPPLITSIELACTCQSFRIQKKGFCKHTNQVKKECNI